MSVRVRRRLNRFAVEVERDDPGGSTTGPLVMHLPNSGRMTELLQAGTRGLARPRPGPSRRTDGELVLVHYNGRWVSVDARMPNRLFAACLAARALLPFASYPLWRSEVRWGSSRFDFLLYRSRHLERRPGHVQVGSSAGARREGTVLPVKPPGEAGSAALSCNGVGTGPPAVVVPKHSPPACLVETKSCNLVEGDVALFPDAPTQRGSRHLAELRDAVDAGCRAAVVWFVQRDDAAVLRPHHHADPAFARALAEAVVAGVEVYAYRCVVTPEAVLVTGSIPVQVPVPPHP